MKIAMRSVVFVFVAAVFAGCLQSTTRTKYVPVSLAKPTSLHNAAGEDSVKYARNLLERGADVNAKDSIGATPLHWAAKSGSDKVAALLLQHGADVNAKTEDNYGSGGFTPLHWAAESRSVKIAALLLKHGADVDERNAGGHTPLHTAAETYGDRSTASYTVGGSEKEKKTVTVLLRHGADVNAKEDFSRRTPLHYVVRAGFAQNIAVLLVQHGADIFAEDAEGKTPFDMSSGKTREFFESTID